MDRVRDGRRGGGGGSVSVGSGPPPPRRRLRSSNGGGPRDSPRSERRRGERLMLNGVGRDDDTSDDSLGDDDDDVDAEEEEELAPRYQPAQQRRSPSTAPPPPSPPPLQQQQHGGGHHHHSSSSSGGGGGYHNHHHHHGHGHGQPQRKATASQKSPIVLKAADEMIGVPVPRKARSGTRHASTKRSSHEWPVPGGGSSGAGEGGSQIQRPSSRPISPASASTTAPARKKLKPLGGGGSTGGSGPAPKQRPSPSSAPSTAPPQPPPPPKISKSPSFIQEEIEVAEVLFGLTKQFPCPPKHENSHKLEHRDGQEAVSGNSPPAPSSSGVRPSDSTSLATTAPKRKRPRLVKYDEDSRPASPAKPETPEPSSRQEAPAAARSEAKTSTSAAAESGACTGPASAQVDTPRGAEKMEDRGRSRDSELRTIESDRRDYRPDSRPEPPPAPSGKADGEATPVCTEAARNGEAIATTKIALASDGARQEKFCIDLMAPPPGKLSPERDGASDPDVDKKGLNSELDMLTGAKSEKKDGEMTRTGLDIDLEDKKVQRIPADEPAPRKLTLQLDLEKPSLGDEKPPSERLQLQSPPLQQQQKSFKSEMKHEKSSMPSVTPPMPLPVGGWMGSFPPFGYLGPVPALSAAGLHPMDVKPGSSSGLPQAALIPPLPTRSKRCATHCFVAQLIEYHQRIAKMNSFWPPTAAAAAAATNRSGPFFGPGPFNMGVVPPTDATSLVNPMQGSYPVRLHTLQESKSATMSSSSHGGLSKDKAALGNAGGAESSQRKQTPAHEVQHSTPMPNMLHGPAFIFPFNQQHAAAMAAASAANRAGDAKSSGSSNAMQLSANAHATATNPGATAMNLSFTGLQPADAQFLAILQNGAYPFQVAAHAGGPPSYRGMVPPGQAVPYFNGHVYPSHMLHSSQQQGAQQQSFQKNPMPSMSNSSHKHQPQSQGVVGYAPNANPSLAVAANNSQNFSSSNQRPVLLPGPTHRQDSGKTGQDGPKSDDKPSHSQKGGYDHSFAVPVHLPNFGFAAQVGSSQSEKSSDHHNQQQQPQASRGQGVRIDLASSQPFVMPFGSIGPPGSASTGLDFSSLAQSHAMFQSHHEVARHGYPQLNFAAAQATQHKPQHQITGETKSVPGDSSSISSVAGSERKKSASTKYPGDSQQHSLSFSRTESKSYGPPFLSGTTNESSSRTLSLIGAESPNAFGSKPSSSSNPASSPATISQMQHQQQQQQHFFQIQQRNQQQFIQQHHLNRPRSAVPSTPGGAGGYPDHLNMANFQSMMYPSGAAQGGSSGQSPQLKASSARVTASSAAVTAPAAPPTNLIAMKNNGLHQQQAKSPMHSLSSPGHQSQSSLSLSASKMGPSVTNISTAGGDLSRSSNAPVGPGSPSNSVSRSTGGSPPATVSAKGVQQSAQLSSQQQSAKNPASTERSKSTPTNHYNMPMPSILGQQPHVSQASNPGSKQQSHMAPSSVKHQQFPQGHFFISNAYTPQPPGPGGAGALGPYQKRPSDKTQQQTAHQQNAMSAASNNMKVHHPPSGSFMHLAAAAAAQSAGGVPHSHMSAAQFSFGAMSMPVKPSSDQKPGAAGK